MDWENLSLKQYGGKYDLGSAVMFSRRFHEKNVDSKRNGSRSTMCHPILPFPDLEELGLLQGI